MQIGPSGRTDARHRATVSAVWNGPWGITVSPIWRYRSALPVNLTDGRDLNANGVANDITNTAFAFDGFDSSGNVQLKEIGPCETINCGRGASQQAFNLRVSKGFRLYGTARVEAIAEIFNLFNALNPATFTGRRFVPTTGAPDPNFLKPTEFSGDFQNPEQRVGQLGFRFTF